MPEKYLVIGSIVIKRVVSNLAWIHVEVNWAIVLLKDDICSQY